VVAAFPPVPLPCAKPGGRGAALFLGFVVMLWLARNAEKSPTRRAMAVGVGHAGIGMLAAATVEALLALSFALPIGTPNLMPNWRRFTCGTCGWRHPSHLGKTRCGAGCTAKRSPLVVRDVSL
jgi:hypothetical protein